MPTISQFYGIKILLWPNDHYPEHFHVRYGEFNAKIDIKTGALLSGNLPPKARALTEEWRLLHLDELLISFELMVKYHKIQKIDGLK